MFFLSQKSKKRSAMLLLVVFGFISVFGFDLLRPATAYAFPVEDISQAIRNVTDNIGSSLLSAGLGAVINGASYFMRKVAYDTAKYVAAGGKGQQPLAFQEGFGKYLTNTALDSAGSAIEQLGEPFGLNLCKPPDIRLQIGLQVNISKIYENEFGGANGEGGPTPRCSWNDFTENWKNSPETMFNDQALLEKFNASLKTSQGDLGVALSIFGKVDNIIAKQQEANQLDRLEGQGFRSLTDIISGDVKTPAQIIKKETDTITGGEQAKLSAQQIAGIYGAGAAQILPMALSVFANTLVNSLLQNVLEKGLLPSKGDASSIANFYASTLSSNRQIAESAFSYLIAGIPQRPLTAYDVVTEYSTCGSNPGLNNCVMDNGLVQAVDRARVGTALTIGEALKQDLLQANWQLIPATQEVGNTNLQLCSSGAYCQSNIEKLRKARILPLGFEIAARKSSPDKPWTLGEVVGDGKSTGFYDCDPSGKPSAAHPFCKLIDPNWILKAPEARCEAQVNGPELLTPSAATRRQECVDFSTCLATDANGQCIGYGYCTQEENTWKMPGQSCDQQFNTCKTYKATDGAIASYLSRTLDVGSCNVNSVGCLAYSTDKSGDQWKQTSTADPNLIFAGRTQAIHLNTRASSLQCPSSAEGCSLFVDPNPAVTNPKDKNVYLKKAPDYLGCYDVDPTTQATIEWPQTQAELTKLATQKSASCSQFAAACTPDEVGCGDYRPADGGTGVTGIIGGNSCPSQCVGYETFKQEVTNFESAKFPLNFIGANAKTCSIQQVGCDEFTNIGAANAGGESLEYYTSLKRCELPTGQNGKSFYSWEGSESQGYILKRHTLVKITDTDPSYAAGLGADVASTEFPPGSPAYVEDTSAVLQTNYDECNQASYNILIHNPYDPKAAHPDCRAFYDSAGGIYYRLLGSTVTVSASCTPLRKTNSELLNDPNIGNANTCGEKGGLWENNQCKRCAAGGRYEVSTAGVGSCVYQSIKAEATSCPATANGCRSYIGNTGNNIYTAASFSFEPSGDSVDALNQAKAGWTGTVSIEPEATQVGLNSLRVNGQNTAHIFTAGTLKAGAWYELRFWARANTSYGLEIGFSQNGAGVGNAFTFDPLTNSSVPAPVGVEWREYRLGPVQLTGDASKDVQLYFSQVPRVNNSFYFLDNVELVQIGGQSSDHTFLIKNSWKTPEGYEVPLACDSTPNDGLPGTYLGCRAYTRGDGQQVTITGFDRLCRAEAVGCRAVVDTENTVSGVRPEEKQAYGVVCRKSNAVSQATPCTVTLEESTDVAPATYSCTVEKGNTECRIKTPVVLGARLELSNTVLNCISDGDSCNASATDKLFIDTSTVVIKADSDAIYLTQQSKFVCAEQQLGCMKVAEEEQNIASTAATSYTYQETFIKNDPRNYGDVLCSGDEVGCAEFKQDNSVAYFKDPKLTGNSLCVYKTNVSFGNNKTYSGWFMDGVGTCSGGSQNGKLCKATGDCGTGSTCTNIGTTACYSNYLQSENSYGLWSQGSSGYKGFVGVCDSGSNGCTELIDRAAVSADNPTGKPYYVLMNDKLTQNIGQCQGKVSQKEGCVLFDQTENPGEKYNTALSYQASVAATPSNSLVVPSEVAPKDSNLILKVERDRQCSEWLACRSATTVFDKDGRPQSLCQQYAACNKLGGPFPGNCASWVDTSLDNTRLTEEKYIKRPTTWNSPEYSGYSLFGAFNPSNYVYFLFRTAANSNAYLAYEMSPAFFTSGSGFEKQGCREVVGAGNNYVKKDGAVCGFDNGGRCYSQRCFYPINGNFTFTPSNQPETDVESMLKELQPGICKSYPETDSPFPIGFAVDNPTSAVTKSSVDGTTTRVEYPDKKDKFAKANICQPGSTSKDCSCEYIKIEYKNGTTDYWPTDTKATPPGVCTSGEKEGYPCSADSQCGATGGTCSLKNRTSTSYGLKGLCLEYDRSRTIGLLKDNAKLFEAFQCLTWLPIQVSASAIDVDNLFSDAGYNPTIDSPTGGQAYCTESTARASGYYDTSLEAVDNNLSLHGEFGGPLQGTLAQPPGSETSFNRLPLYMREKDGTTLDVEYAFDTGTDALGNYDRDHVATPVFDSTELTDYYGKNHVLIYKRFISGQSNSNEYGHLMRVDGATSDEKLEMMRLFQAYAWKNIGPSSRILRLDTRGVNNDDLTVRYDEDSATVPSAKNVYGFAPLFSGVDTGVLMHPPRLWSQLSSNEAYYMNPKFIQFAPIVGTMAFSPDYNAGSNNTFIYNDYNVESSLTEADVKSVHFVPIAFPDGSEGYNPALLTTEVSVDFNYLQRSSRVEGGSSVVPAYRDGSGTEGGPHDQHTYNIDSSYGERMNRVSYLLERNNDPNAGDDCSKNGLLSFCDYRKMEASGQRYNDYGNASPEERDRTQIYHRYVALIFASADTDTGQQFNSLLGSSLQVPNSQETDPFLATCKAVGNHFRNWLAIGMDFNKKGEFLGYISRWCMNTGNASGEANGIRFATIADMQDRCVEYSAVVDTTDPIKGTSKAWTDRVWAGSVFAPSTDPLSFFSLVKNSENAASPGIKPYGSLPQNVADAGILKSTGPKEPIHVFSDYMFGVPYQCQGGDGFGSTIKHIFAKNCTPPQNDTGSSKITSAIVKNGDQGSEILRNLFLKYYAVKNVESGSSKDATDPNADKSGDTSLITGTFPPRIFAINPSTCSFGTCTAAEADTFTVNSRNYTLEDYNGDGIPDEDKNRDGHVDPIIGEGSYTTVIDFFAYADDNRMPIKRVMVNWGDGTPVDSQFGLYKNRKPYCASGNDTTSLGDIGRCTGTQITCRTDNDCGLSGGTCVKGTSIKFGDALRACDQKYFERTHTYFCSPQDTKAVAVSTLRNTDPEAYTRLTSRSGITDSSKVCVFTPGVQVLDNWGWCNGTCTVSYDSSGNPRGGSQNGCYDEVHWVGPNQSFSTNQCDKSISNDDATSNPWTFFKGSIIVLPN